MLKAANLASDSPSMATPGRLDALFDLSRKLASCLDLDDVLREVGLCASALTGAHAVTLERYDRQARALVAFGSGAPVEDADADAARRVLKTHDPEAVEADGGSALVAALVSRDEAVGVMRIRYHERHEFARHEIEFFQSLADVVASAIANALLYARLSRDITERERAEKELRAAEWRYRKLVEDMPVGTYVNSLEGHMTYISPHIEPVHGRGDFRLFLAHNPKLAPLGERAGFDLQLSGHTHAGQFFPWTLAVRLVHAPHVAGLSRERGMQVYVSAGTGTWGPPVRFGTSPELTLIRLVRADSGTGT